MSINLGAKWKENELHFGTVKSENPKRHLSEHIQEAAGKTSLQN